MKFHIVRNGESVDKILFLYSLNKDELIEANKHIRAWDKLIPGVKLKIPVISENIDQDILEMEPFIEDYYPKKSINNNSQEATEAMKINLEEVSEKNNSNNMEDINSNIKSDNQENKEVLKTNDLGEESKNCYDEYNTLNRQENNNHEINQDKEKEEPKIVPLQKAYPKVNNTRKLNYYPYYYYNPYYGQYFVYYYPAYTS